MSSGPTEIHCPTCKKRVPVSGLTLADTKFSSKKKAIEMNRKTWVGKCSVCQRNVRQFASTPKAPPQPSETPETQISQ